MNQTNGNGELSDPESLPLPGVLGNSHRLREIAIQQMIARARLGRSLRTKSLAPGEAANYQINEEVDYYRPPTNKDTPGWTGPARIVDLTQIHRGTVGIDHQGRTLTCRLGALGRHLSFLRSIYEISSCFFGPTPWHIEIRHRVKQIYTIILFGFEILKLKIRRLKWWKPGVCFESALLSTTDHSLGIIPTVKALVERLVDGSVINFGLVKLNKPDGSTYWHNTAVTNHRGNGYAKLQQFADQCLNIDGSLQSESPKVWVHSQLKSGTQVHCFCGGTPESLGTFLPMNTIVRRPSAWDITFPRNGMRFASSKSYVPPTSPPANVHCTSQLRDSAQVSNADPDRQQRENNHDLTGRVDDANNDMHATSSPSGSGLLAPIPEESTQPSTSEFDETDQFFTHEEPDLRHAVHPVLKLRFFILELTPPIYYFRRGKTEIGRRGEIRSWQDFSPPRDFLTCTGMRTSWWTISLSLSLSLSFSVFFVCLCRSLSLSLSFSLWYHIILCYIILCYTILYYTILCTILYDTTLHTILYGTTLYYTIPYPGENILYCTIL